MLPERISQTIQYFSGRTWLLPKLGEWYKNVTQDYQGKEKPSPRYLLITGEPGTGKSMVAAWLAGYGPEPEEDDERKQLLELRSQIKAAHFFQANTQNSSPHSVADSLAKQLAERVPGFADAVKAVLDTKVVINANFKAGDIYGNATNVSIKLDLSNILDELVFSLAVYDPLKRLYEAGYTEQIVLLLDSLDEAYLYGQGLTIRTLASLEDLSPWVRVVATTRSDPRVLKFFPKVPQIYLEKDAPDVDAEVHAYVLGRLAAVEEEFRPSLQRRAELAEEIKKHAGGYFLYAYLVVEDVITALKNKESLAEFHFPAGLRDYYQDRLNREINETEWKQVGPVLGVVSVAKGDGIHGDRLQTIFGDVELTLRQFKAYLDGELAPGPFRPFHRSFSEYLLEDKENKDYHLDAHAMHRKFADYYLALNGGKEPWNYWDEYGLRYVSDHLAGASRGGEALARHEQAKRLVDLVVNAKYRKRQLGQIKELSEQQRQFDEALRATVVDPLPEAIPLILRVATEKLTFRRETLKPEFIFETAAQGDVNVAVGNLPLFTTEPRWVKAVSLMAAWLAPEAKADQARTLFERVRSQDPHLVELDRLATRVGAALGVAASPDLPPPGEAPPDDVMEALLARLGTGEVDFELLAEHVYTGLNVYPSATANNPLGPGTDVEPMFLARQDGPLLVAYATPPENQEKASTFLRRYLDLHEANPYVYYRNLSLWLFMSELTVHPDATWTRDALRAVMTSALLPSGYAFTESFALLLLALHARENDGAARQELDLRMKNAVDASQHLFGDASGHDNLGLLQRHLSGLGKAYSLPEDDNKPIDDMLSREEKSDIWGDHKRRFSALGQAYSLLAGGDQLMNSALGRAGTLPAGFAGFMAPAWLNYAETLHICGMVYPIQYALDQALQAAHNIQESSFAARTTARVNAIQRRWWPFPGDADLESLVRNLRQNPLESRFCSVYIVGENFQHREERPNKLLIPAELLQANTLRVLATQMNLTLADLILVNAEQGWQADDALAVGTQVNVPDSEFTPLLACRLAAEIVRSATLNEVQKRLTLQSLIPLAINELTALDTVLARLLMALPEDAYILDDLAALVADDSIL